MDQKQIQAILDNTEVCEFAGLKNFRDVTPIFANPEIFKMIVNWMCDQTLKIEATAVAGIESRGFPFASAVAFQLGLPLILFRKPNKLPRRTISWSYTKEYGKDTLEVHVDSIKFGDKLAIIDDLAALGGTLGAACKIAKLAGATSECLTVFRIAGLAAVRDSNIESPLHSLVAI